MLCQVLTDLGIEAEICSEIAEQHCAELHVTTTAEVIATDQHAVSGPLPARLR